MLVVELVLDLDDHPGYLYRFQLSITLTLKQPTSFTSARYNTGNNNAIHIRHLRYFKSNSTGTFNSYSHKYDQSCYLPTFLI